MGIQGLLPALRQSTRAVNLGEYKNKRVGVDTYGWLHKGCIQCAMELGQGIPTAKYIQFVMSRVDLLRHFKVIPVMVFDGGALPMKKAVEKERRRNREGNIKRAMELLRQGQRSQAEEYFQRGVDVTPQMACSVIQILRSQNVEFIVAPYEADAQLAYLARTGYIDVVISEDSDLLAYQTPRVLFKMDKFGNGMEVSLVDLPDNDAMSLAHFTPSMVLTMCIMAGCDYLPNLFNIGVKTAHRLVKQHRTIERILQVLAQDPKYSFSSSELQTYAAGFQRALLTFQHHLVYDPITRDIRPLTPLEGPLPDDWPFLGHQMDTATARSVCEGFAHPYTYELYPNDLTEDAKLYRTASSRRLSGQDATLAVAVAPPNAVELVGQRRLTSLFLARPTTVAQSEASKAPFVSPRVASPNGEVAPGDADKVEEEEEEVAVPVKRRRVVLSRFFAELQQPIQEGSEGSHLSDGTGPEVRQTISAANAIIAETEVHVESDDSSSSSADSHQSQPSCPHNTPNCDGHHSVFYNCRQVQQSATSSPMVRVDDPVTIGPFPPLFSSDVRDVAIKGDKESLFAEARLTSTWRSRNHTSPTAIPGVLQPATLKAKSSPLVNSSLKGIGIRHTLEIPPGLAGYQRRRLSLSCSDDTPTPSDGLCDAGHAPEM